MTSAFLHFIRRSLFFPSDQISEEIADCIADSLGAFLKSAADSIQQHQGSIGILSLQNLQGDLLLICSCLTISFDQFLFRCGHFHGSICGSRSRCFLRSCCRLLGRSVFFSCSRLLGGSSCFLRCRCRFLRRGCCCLCHCCRLFCGCCCLLCGRCCRFRRCCCRLLRSRSRLFHCGSFCGSRCSLLHGSGFCGGCCSLLHCGGFCGCRRRLFHGRFRFLSGSGFLGGSCCFLCSGHNVEPPHFFPDFVCIVNLPGNLFNPSCTCFGFFHACLAIHCSEDYNKR